MKIVWLIICGFIILPAGWFLAVYRRDSQNSLKHTLLNPQIVIIKSKRQLMLYSENKLVRTYDVGLGFNPVPDKVKEGDGATPEGEFYIFTKNERSSYYLSLGISYPNIEDAQRGLRDQLISEEQYNQIVNANRSRGIPPQNTPLGGRCTFTDVGRKKIGRWVAWH